MHSLFVCAPWRALTDESPKHVWATKKSVVYSLTDFSAYKVKFSG